jgi:hypothetical protein
MFSISMMKRRVRRLKMALTYCLESTLGQTGGYVVLYAGVDVEALSEPPSRGTQSTTLFVAETDATFACKADGDAQCGDWRRGT